MNILRAVIGIGGLALLAVVLWAAFGMQDLHGGVLDQGAVLVTLPWGVATLADLYFGFVLFAIVVFLTERSWLVALLWALPILFVGNIWAAFWLAIRLPRLARLLSKPDEQAS